MVGVAASVRLDGDTVTEARIAVSGVAGQLARAAEAQTLLVGQRAGEESFAIEHL